MTLPVISEIRQQVTLALAEDIGPGDLTASLVSTSQIADVRVICRQPAVIAGQAWFDETFRQLDDGIQIDWLCHDSDQVEAQTVICHLQGKAQSILSGERVALNFLQLLSGVATRTRQFVDKVGGLDVKILDTRKTIPGLRLAQKYAVTCGGGYNHRIGLYDAVLIKENHIRAAGSIPAALEMVLQTTESIEVEIEVETLDELQQALDAGARRILLDNFSIEELTTAVNINQKRARLEASGGVTFETVKNIAQTGVDDISVGELTKDVQAIDLSMLFS